MSSIRPPVVGAVCVLSTEYLGINIVNCANTANRSFHNNPLGVEFRYDVVENALPSCDISGQRFYARFIGEPGKGSVLATSAKLAHGLNDRNG